MIGLVLRTVLERRQSTGSRQATIADELEQLARLLERGVLTQDEFAREEGKVYQRPPVVPGLSDDGAHSWPAAPTRVN